MKALFVVTVAALIAFGCASTDISSVNDPAHIGVKYGAIVMVAPFDDIESRRTAEGWFVEEFGELGITAIPSMLILPPTREYTSEEFDAKIVASNADGVMYISLTDSYETQTYVPQSSTTTGSIHVYGSSAYYSETTQHSGGYFVGKPVVKYYLRLIDVESGETAWVASSTTRGNAYASFGTLMFSLADKASKQLLKDGKLDVPTK